MSSKMLQIANISRPIQQDSFIYLYNNNRLGSVLKSLGGPAAVYNNDNGVIFYVVSPDIFMQLIYQHTSIIEILEKRIGLKLSSPHFFEKLEVLREFVDSYEFPDKVKKLLNDKKYTVVS